MRRCVVRWTSVVSLLGLVALAAPARAEGDKQIPADVLKQVKAATTFIKVKFEKTDGTGTGFLVHAEGNTGYVVTNVHVIAPLDVTPPKIIVTPSLHDGQTPEWTRTFAPPRSSTIRRGPTLPSTRRPGTPSIPRPGMPRPGMPRSPIVGSRPGYRPPPPINRGPSSRSTMRVQLIPGKIEVLLPKSIEVVFDSGRASERIFSAMVAAVDMDHNLAVLKVENVANLPTPIKSPEELDLLETTPVYVFGFPFGKKLAMNNGNPAMTVGSGTISSIRDDEDGDTQIVQIDGDINPGNSGGPVIDVNGQLIGLAVAGISETNIGLAVPATELTAMLAGRVGDVKVTHAASEPGTAKVDVEVRLIDPLHKITNTVIRYRPTDELPPAKANENGEVAEEEVVALPGATQFDLKIDGRKAIGSTTVKGEGKLTRNYTLQVAYTTAKETVNLPPAAPYEVKFQPTPVNPGVAINIPKAGGQTPDQKFQAAVEAAKDPKIKVPAAGKPNGGAAPSNTNVVIPAIAKAAEPVRTWTDASGTFSVEASFIEVKDGKARLKRTDGKTVSIMLDKLSAADQKFLAQRPATR